MSARSSGSGETALCAGSPEPLLFDVICTSFSWIGSNSRPVSEKQVAHGPRFGHLQLLPICKCHAASSNIATATRSQI